MRPATSAAMRGSCTASSEPSVVSTTMPVFSVQYHPEAAPGPNDADPLFVDFYRLIEARKAGKI